MMSGKFYFYSYVWEPEPGRCKFANAVREKHPVEIVKEWAEKYDGNNDATLLYWREITSEEYRAFRDQLHG